MRAGTAVITDGAGASGDEHAHAVRSFLDSRDQLSNTMGTDSGPRIARVSLHVAGPARKGWRATILVNAALASSCVSAAPKQ